MLPNSGTVEHFDSIGNAIYSYDDAMKELISYENATMTRSKVTYIQSVDFGGDIQGDCGSTRDYSTNGVYPNSWCLQVGIHLPRPILWFSHVLPTTPLV
jgi:GH18 family chitinase